MRTYEMMTIYNPKFAQDKVKQEIKEVEQLISSNGGNVITRDYIGIKNLAYKIKHNTQGYYNVMSFELPSDKVAELTRSCNFKIKEDVIMRNMITAS